MPELQGPACVTRRVRKFQPQTGCQGGEAYDGDYHKDGNGRVEVKSHSEGSEAAPEPGHEKAIGPTDARLGRSNARLATAAFVVIHQHQKNPDFWCLNPEQAMGFQCPLPGTW